jgi:hypothetical protein
MTVGSCMVLLSDKWGLGASGGMGWWGYFPSVPGFPDITFTWACLDLLGKGHIPAPVVPVELIQ